MNNCFGLWNFERCVCIHIFANGNLITDVKKNSSYYDGSTMLPNLILTNCAAVV